MDSVSHYYGSSYSHKNNMKNSELIILPKLMEKGGRVMHRSRLILPGFGAHDFSFCIPEEHDDPRMELHANHHLLAMLMPAMRVGGKLTVRGRVDEKLMKSLEGFIHYWVRWCPDRLQMVEIEADEWTTVVPDQENAAICCFSGGVDSMHAYLRFPKEKGIPVKSLMFMHGYDIDLDRREFYQGVADQYEEWFKADSVKLIRLEANARATAKKFQLNWGSMAHGVFLAAGLHLFSHSHNKGCIASSDTPSTLIYPWGSNPVTDPLLSGNSMELTHFDCRFSKFDKVKELVDHPELCRLLRVCYRSKTEEKNCGRCGKCLRTLIKMHLVRENSWKEAFPSVANLDEALESLEATDFPYAVLQQFAHARDYALRHATGDLAERLDALIDRKNRQLTPIRTRLRQWFYDRKVRVYVKHPSLIKKDK
jgi:hypothetical protein